MKSSLLYRVFQNFPTRENNIVTLYSENVGLFMEKQIIGTILQSIFQWKQSNYSTVDVSSNLYLFQGNWESRIYIWFMR